MITKLELAEGKQYFVYIAGKITGLTPEEYRSIFNSCRDWLSHNIWNGYQIITPTDLCEDDWDWSTCMEICVNALKKCVAVYFLPNWKESKGATCERYIATALGLRIIDIEVNGAYIMNNTVDNSYYFKNQVKGFTDFSGSFEYKAGDIVITRDGCILDYQGVIGQNKTVYSILIDRDWTVHYFDDYYVDCNVINKLANPEQIELFNVAKKHYLKA